MTRVTSYVFLGAPDMFFAGGSLGRLAINPLRSEFTPLGAGMNVLKDMPARKPMSCLWVKVPMVRWRRRGIVSYVQFG